MWLLSLTLTGHEQASASEAENQSRPDMGRIGDVPIHTFQAAVIRLSSALHHSRDVNKHLLPFDISPRSPRSTTFGSTYSYHAKH
jgi:hypothetical protein